MVSVATEATSFSFIPIAGMAAASRHPSLPHAQALHRARRSHCSLWRNRLHHHAQLSPVDAAAWDCLCVDAQKIENIILNFVQILTRKDLPLYTIRTETPIDIDEAIDKEYGMPSLHQRSQGYTHV